MFKLPRILTLGLFALLVLLAGCGQTPPRTYAVKAYSGGEVVGSFDASSYSSGNGRIYANMPNGRQNTVGGTYSVRRTDPGANSSTARVTKFVAELYSGGKVVESVKAASYTTGDTKVYLTVSNSSEQIVFGGTYILRNIGANLEGKSDGAKYKVTVYSDGILVGTWYADAVTGSGGRISLKVNGINEAMVIGGEYVVEQFR